MLNLIGVHFKACTLGQKDYFWKVVIYNGFVYKCGSCYAMERLVMSCGQNIEFCEHAICQLHVFDFTT